MAEYKMQFRDGFLDRTKQMSGLKTDEAFAGAIGVSESVLARAKKKRMHTTHAHRTLQSIRLPTRRNRTNQTNCLTTPHNANEQKDNQ